MMALQQVFVTWPVSVWFDYLTLANLKYNNLVAVPQDNNIYIGRLKAIGY